MQHWFTYPNIDPVAFRLGPLAVHWYGLSYLFGFICVFLWMNRPAGRRRMGLTTDNIQDFLIYALIGVLIGGRLVFVIADVITNNNLADYLHNPIDFIAIWKGGMAFHGALIGVIVALTVNWFGDSLDGTLARVRNRLRNSGAVHRANFGEDLRGGGIGDANRLLRPHELAVEIERISFHWGHGLGTFAQSLRNISMPMSVSGC